MRFLLIKVLSQQPSGQWQKQRNIRTKIAKHGKRVTHETNTNKADTRILKCFVRTPYEVKLKIIRNMTKRDKLPSAGMNSTTYWICRNDIPGGRTNVKQRKVSEAPSGKLKTNNVHARRIRFRIPPPQKKLITKIAPIWCLLSCKVRKLRCCW